MELMESLEKVANNQYEREYSTGREVVDGIAGGASLGRDLGAVGGGVAGATAGGRMLGVPGVIGGGLLGAGIGALGGSVVGAANGGGLGLVNSQVKKSPLAERGEDQSHLQHDATVGAISGAGIGALSGARGGIKGAIAKGLGGAIGGGAIGATVGERRDNREEENEMIQTASENLLASLEKVASETFAEKTYDLMSSLEKVANEAYVEKTERVSPEDRVFEIQTELGTAHPRYLKAALEQEGLLEYAVEQGLFKDFTPTEQAVVGGGLGGLTGAAFGAAANAGGSGKAMLGGAGLGLALGGALGAGVGALRGKVQELNPSEQHQEFHGEGAGPRYQYRTSAGSVGHDAAGMAQTASEDLMASLEKVAANVLSGTMNTLKKSTGKDLKAATKQFNTQNTPEALKANAPQAGVAKFRQNLEGLEGTMKAEQAATSKARKQVATGAALTGAGALGGVAVAKKDNEKIASEVDPVEEGQEKTASEVFMSELYKEAATAILDTYKPEIKDYSDPINRIKF